MRTFGRAAAVYIHAAGIARALHTARRPRAVPAGILMEVNANGN